MRRGRHMQSFVTARQIPPVTAALCETESVIRAILYFVVAGPVTGNAVLNGKTKACEHQEILY